MKIIHILNSNSYSGAENVVITIINKMKSKHDIIYVSPEGSIRQYLENNDIKYEPIKKVSMKEIKRIIRKYKPDIIHAHDFTASIISSICGKNVKVISHLHSNPTWIKSINLKTILYLISTIKYNKILMVSKSILNEYIFKKYIQKKSLIIGNPIDINKIIEQANSKEIEEYYDLAFIGRLTELKNPEEFIEIVNILKRKLNIRAVMIGTGPMKEKCIDLIEKYNLTDVIILKGFMKNPYNILKNCKILCMTSRYEGYGLVAVEALALGKPVVASKVGGLPDIIDEKCGKLSNDITEIITEIEKLLINTNYYKNKSEYAIIRANEINNIDKYIKNLNEIYSSYL